jgi:hypothetical protein
MSDHSKAQPGSKESGKKIVIVISIVAVVLFGVLLAVLLSRGGGGSADSTSGDTSQDQSEPTEQEAPEVPSVVDPGWGQYESTSWKVPNGEGFVAVHFWHGIKADAEKAYHFPDAETIDWYDIPATDDGRNNIIIPFRILMNNSTDGVASWSLMLGDTGADSKFTKTYIYLDNVGYMPYESIKDKFNGTAAEHKFNIAAHSAESLKGYVVLDNDGFLDTYAGYKVDLQVYPVSGRTINRDYIRFFHLSQGDDIFKVEK